MDADLEALLRFACELPGRVKVQLLPYHRLGEPKYAMLRRQYALKGLMPPSEESVAWLTEMAKASGVSVRVVA